MNQLETLEFEVTVPERDRVNAWLLEEGFNVQLEPKETNLYGGGWVHPNPAEKKPYLVTLPTEFKLRAKQWLLDLLVNR